MPKSKQQKQAEAQARRLDNMPRIKARLELAIQGYDPTDAYLHQRLKERLAAFELCLKESGRPHGDGAYHIRHGKVIVTEVIGGKFTSVGNVGYRKCLYCAQSVGHQHTAPCDIAWVWPHEGLVYDPPK